MSERIAAAASQPTPEQVRAAHEALGLLRAPSQQSVSISCAQHLVDAIAKFIPPLPEPERPRITPVELKANQLLSDVSTGWCSRPCIKHILRQRDAEIIAWLEWEMRKSGMAITVVQWTALLKAIREADTP